MEKKTPDAMKLGEIIHLIFEYNMTNTSGKLLDLVIADADESALLQYRRAVKAKMDEVDEKSKQFSKQLNSNPCDFVPADEIEKDVSQLHESYNRAVRRG